MDARRWTRLQSLFERAVALSDDEQRRFLERECGPDADLQTDLESLVRAHRRAESQVEDAVLGTLSSILGPEGEARRARRALSRLFERASTRSGGGRRPARSDSAASRER